MGKGSPGLRWESWTPTNLRREGLFGTIQVETRWMYLHPRRLRTRSDTPCAYLVYFLSEFVRILREITYPKPLTPRDGKVTQRPSSLLPPLTLTPPSSPSLVSVREKHPRSPEIPPSFFVTPCPTVVGCERVVVLRSGPAVTELTQPTPRSGSSSPVGSVQATRHRVVHIDVQNQGHRVIVLLGSPTPELPPVQFRQSVHDPGVGR